MTKTNPLVSVVVPVYNTKKYLSTCLDSILSQTYQNLEIIVIDDGSTDDSYQIAGYYAKSNPRIKLFHQTNQGLSAARNTGIKKSTGDYITFVDSDDYIEPEMIAKLVSALQSSHADIAVCSFQETYPNGKISHPKNNPPATVYDTENALSAMLQERGFMVSATMKLFPRAYFKSVKFPVGKLHEDLGTTYQLIMQAKTIAYLPDPYYVYCHHGESITTKTFDTHKFDILTLTDQMCDDIDQKFPSLIHVTNERRMRARFSVLRQIPLNHPKLPKILDYIKAHQPFITENPIATKTDKIALRLALLSPRLFQSAYKLFK